MNRNSSFVENGEFWRSAIQFFIKHADQLTPGQIEAIVEFLYAVRIRPLVNGDGSERLPPPDPNFSLAGRTPASLLRLAGMQGGPDELGVGWPSSGWPSMLLDDELGQWRMVELLDAWSLQHEGQVLRHCVRIYWRDCASGRSRIWSLRWRDDQGPYAPRCTIEVRTRTRTIMQIRGYQNRRVSGRMRELIERWADLAGLRIAQFAW